MHFGEALELSAARASLRCVIRGASNPIWRSSFRWKPAKTVEWPILLFFYIWQIMTF